MNCQAGIPYNRYGCWLDRIPFIFTTPQFYEVCFAAVLKIIYTADDSTRFVRTVINMTEQNRQAAIWKAVTISAIIVAAVVIVAGCKKKSPKQPETKPPQQKHSPSLNNVIKAARTWGPAYKSWYGKMAPDFTLTDITGKRHKLSDYRGKDVMLVFWGTWCPPCKMEIPHLIELRKTVSQDKLAILAISNEKPEVVKKFAADKKMNYTLLLEQGGMPKPFGVMRIFGTVGVPCSFFIDPEGKIKFATVGLLSLDPIKAILQAE